MRAHVPTIPARLHELRRASTAGEMGGASLATTGVSIGIATTADRQDGMILLVRACLRTLKTRTRESRQDAHRLTLTSRESETALTLRATETARCEG